MKTRTISRFPLGYDGKMLLLDQHLIMMLQEQNQHKSKAMTSQQRDWLAAKMVHDATAITMLYEHQHDKVRSTDATRARDHFGKHSLFAKWWFLFSECWVVNAGEIMTQQGTGVGCFPCFSGDRVTWIVGEHTLVSTSEAEKTGKKKERNMHMAEQKKLLWQLQWDAPHWVTWSFIAAIVVYLKSVPHSPSAVNTLYTTSVVLIQRMEKRHRRNVWRQTTPRCSRDVQRSFY